MDLSRRQVLSRGTLAAGIGVAGCLGIGGSQCETGRAVYESDTSLPSDAAWPQFQCDASNTSYNQAGSVPAEVSLHWRYSACKPVDSGVTVADGRVYPGHAIVDGKTGTHVAGEWGGYQHPAVVDGTLYVGSHSLEAYDAEDGTDLWTFEPDGDAGAVTPPTVHNGTIYIAGNLDDPTIYAVGASDGTEQWRFSPDADCNISPAVDDESVYVTDEGGAVYGLDASTGRVQWRRSPDGMRRPRAPAVSNGSVYIASADGTVVAFDRADGQERWRHQPPLDHGRTLAVAAETVYVAGSEECLALATADGTVEWTADAGGPACSIGPQTVLLGGGQTLQALSREDGTKLWEFETRMKMYTDHGVAGIPVAPAIVDECVFVATEAGDIYALGPAE